jgi:hypothetical protein
MRRPYGAARIENRFWVRLLVNSLKEEGMMPTSRKSTSMIAAAVVLFAVNILISTTYAEIDPATAVGIWLFNEGQGGIAEDSSGEGHNGEIGKGIKWNDGQYGSEALQFPGNAVVIVPHDDSLNLVTWTVTAWIRSDFKNGWVEFVSKSDPVGNTDFRNYVLQIENDTGLLRPHFTQGAQQWKLTAGTTDLRDGEWHHVAGTYDQNSIKAYVDGELEGEAAFNNVPDTNEEPLVIGAIALTKNFFTGAIDEVGLFNVASTHDDIRTIMKEGLAKALAVFPSGKLTTTWAYIRRHCQIKN